MTLTNCTLGVAGLVAQANEKLGWSATLGLDEMCRDAWKWQSSNPDGYRTPESDSADAGAK